MLKKLIAGVTVVLVTGAGLSVTTTAAHARISKPTISVPANGVVGKAFRISVRTHGDKGTVVLQRRVAGTTAWHAVDRTRARVGKATVFSRTEHRAGRFAFRAVLGRAHSTAAAITVKKPAPPPPPGPSMFVTVGADTDNIFVGQVYTVSAALTRGDQGMANQPVLIEKKAQGASTWTTVANLTTDSNGEVETTDSSSKAGLTTYRATSGSITGSSAVVIWQTVDMPGPAGGLAVTKQGCGAAASATADEVDLKLTSTPASPGPPPVAACPVKVGDFVRAQWNLPAGCTDIHIGNITLDGTAGTAVEVQVSVDGNGLVDKTLNRMESTGKISISGDPMDQLVVRMQVTQGAGGTFTGIIAQPDAICNGVPS